MPPKAKTNKHTIAEVKRSDKKGSTDPISNNFKTGEIIFKLVEGVPKSTYGLPESVYESLITNLRNMQPNKNHLPFSLKYKLVVSKIIKEHFPDYVVRYSTNKEKETCAVWRTA